MRYTGRARNDAYLLSCKFVILDLKLTQYIMHYHKKLAHTLLAELSTCLSKIYYQTLHDTLNLQNYGPVGTTAMQQGQLQPIPINPHN